MPGDPVSWLGGFKTADTIAESVGIAVAEAAKILAVPAAQITPLVPDLAADELAVR